MSLANGSYMAFFLASTVLSNTVGTFNHALGATPFVHQQQTVLNGNTLSMAANPLVLVSRTTSYVALYNQSATTWVGDVACDAIHSIRQ